MSKKQRNLEKKFKNSKINTETEKRLGFLEFMNQSPLKGIKLNLKRDRSKSQDIEI